MKLSSQDPDPADLDNSEILVAQLDSLVHGRATNSPLEASDQIRNVSTELHKFLHPNGSRNRPAEDGFRQAGGLDVALNALQQCCSPQEGHAVQADGSRLKLIQHLLFVLAKASQDDTLDGPTYDNEMGDAKLWPAIETALASFIVQTLEAGTDTHKTLLTIASLHDALLTAAMSSEDPLTLFSDLSGNEGLPIDATVVESDANVVSSRQGTNDVTAAALKKALGLGMTLKHPSAARALLVLALSTYELLSRDAEEVLEASDDTSKTVPGTTKSTHRSLPVHVLVVVRLLIVHSEHNLMNMHATGVLAIILPALVVRQGSDAWTEQLLAVARILLKVGFNDTKDARLLMSSSSHSDMARTLVLDALQLSQDAPCILFDLSVQGFASLELPELKQPFPSIDPAKGYTLMFWMKVDTFDGKCHTTLFGAFDSSQTCFLLVYLERRNRYLVLQTSISAKEPSVRFKDVNFQEGTFYHIALVHRRSRGDHPGVAKLFVDGTLREQIRCVLPRTSPLVASSRGKHGQATYPAPVQAFFGTPHDLSPDPKPGRLQSRWSLASGHLINETVADELIYVFHKLGPSYRGNFQDSLGSFQTYNASALVNSHNEKLHPGQEDQSLISKAVKSQAGNLVPGTSILINVSPAYAQTSRSSTSIKHNVPVRSSQVNSKRLTTSGTSILNAAASKRHSGHGSIVGGSTVTLATTMQDCSWRMVGCVSLGLTLVARATTPKDLLCATTIFFESFRNNWRNSEAMERSGGYAILSWLLQLKFDSQATVSAFDELSPLQGLETLTPTERDSLSADLLKLVLRSTTMHYDSPSKAMITNPLAYRMLVIDNDLWQRVGGHTQQLFFDQITMFLTNSRCRDFNAKRLTRMRIFKRFIEILKGNKMSADGLVTLLKAFSSLLKHAATADTLRSTALYITYALHVSPRLTSTAAGPSFEGPNEGFVSATPDLERAIVVLQTLKDFLCEADQRDSTRRFARSVTTQWLLHLLRSKDERVVVPTLSILTRTLAVAGDSFRNKFESKRGFVIVSKLLQRWCYEEKVWLSVLGLLFNLDINVNKIGRLSDLGRCLDTAQEDGKVEITCPGAWDIVTSMLETGLEGLSTWSLESAKSLDISNNPESDSATAVDRISREELYLTVISFLSALYQHVPVFRDFLTNTEIIRSILTILFEATSKLADPRSSPPNGAQMRIAPGHRGYAEDEVKVKSRRTPSMLLTLEHRRVSEYVVLQAANVDTSTNARFSKPLGPSKAFPGGDITQGRCFISTVRLLASVAIEQIGSNAEFSGLGLFLKAPDVSSTRRSWLNSFVMHHVLCDLENKLDMDDCLFRSTKALTNTVKFLQQSCDAVLEGWYVDQSCTLIRVMASFLRRLGQRDIRNLKSVRLCTPSIVVISHLLLMISLFQLGQVLERHSHELQVEQPSPRPPLSTEPAEHPLTLETTLFRVLYETSAFVITTSDSDRVVETPLRSEPRFVPAFCASLITILQYKITEIQTDLLQVFRQLASPNLAEVRSSLKATAGAGEHAVAEDFLVKLLRGEDQDAVDYLKSHEQQLSALLSDVPRVALDSIIHESNGQTVPTAKTRLARREERLNAAHLIDLEKQHALTEYEASSRAWNQNITSAEAAKTARCRQDRQENAAHMLSQYRALKTSYDELLSDSELPHKWSLDESEGRDRMRLRLAPSADAPDLNYRPKRSTRSKTVSGGVKQENSQPRRTRAATIAQVTSGDGSKDVQDRASLSSITTNGQDTTVSINDDEFELIEGQAPSEDGEDKNRKVMRSLQQGEQVQNVYNTSRVRGLEAFEGLLIIGLKALYLVDGLFQRADGEIVDTANAPDQERDPYVQMISGRTLSRGRDPGRPSTNGSTRHWAWREVISISKRNFLLRPVAIEVFFEDGRSYLLTASSEQDRDKLYSELLGRSNRLQPSNTTQGADEWRSDLLVNAKEATGTVTGRFANALSFGTAFSPTARWIKGELSNFQYLVLVNTLAGRTFNDLTQYPIFPWVLADYTSDELDLTNPRTFRDLSKPMGCQNPERELAFRDRYKTFAEMSDDRTTAFHYGTHYSTAMIVTSYLIRLQPYVDSYLLLQGGSFDHADRLFYSIGKAWASASETNMTDVRELIPEFFYLPEMFTNINEYDFGSREATGESISDVQLPPWAKGDAKLFIAKHREALESPYVSQNLHRWIDLIFGSKQKGEAAVEATNVFHHLSYQGSINLDTIDDPVERLATIGIIHNFGQTPRQVFGRPHEQRESLHPKTKRLHRGIERLNPTPACIFEYHTNVCSIEYFDKQQRVLCAGPGRSFMRPDYGIVLDWGHVDGSIRFWRADTKKTRPLATYEQLHQEEITAAVFANTTLVTSSLDCTVALWNVTPNVDAEKVDLQPETFLFGHRHPVSILAVSSVLSLILSVDSSGSAFLWDLNTHDKIRQIKLDRSITSARINSTTGHLLFASDDSLLLYTVNGQLILNHRVCTAADDKVFCCAFYVSSGNDWMNTELIFSGHRRGIANVWKLSNDQDGQWKLDHVRRLAHFDRSQSEGRASAAPITAIQPTDMSIFTGDETGRVFEWKYTT